MNFDKVSNTVLLENYEGEKMKNYQCCLHNHWLDEREFERERIIKKEILRRMVSPEVIKLEVK